MYRAFGAPEGSKVSYFTTWVSRQKLRSPTAQASEQSAFALAEDWSLELPAGPRTCRDIDRSASLPI